MKMNMKIKIKHDKLSVKTDDIYFADTIIQKIKEYEQAKERGARAEQETPIDQTTVARTIRRQTKTRRKAVRSKTNTQPQLIVKAKRSVSRNQDHIAQIDSETAVKPLRKKKRTPAPWTKDEIQLVYNNMRHGPSAVYNSKILLKRHSRLAIRSKYYQIKNKKYGSLTKDMAAYLKHLNATSQYANTK